MHIKNGLDGWWTRGEGPGGYSGINVMGGVRRSLKYFAPKKIHGPYIVHPKKYKTGNYLNHAFGYCGNFGLNCVRTISLAEIRTQKNTRRFFRPKKNTRLNLQPKKIQELKILDPKKYVGPPRHVYTRVPPWGGGECLLSRKSMQTNLPSFSQNSSKEKLNSKSSIT